MKSNKTINMAAVENPPVKPGFVFDREKAAASLAKAAYFVGSADQCDLDTIRDLIGQAACFRAMK